MKKHDAPLRKHSPIRGVLHEKSDVVLAGHARYLPSATLAPFVEHYWTVAWDLAEPRLRETLPHPCVHLLLDQGAALIGGVGTRRFTRLLQGRGQVFGIKFRPGGFRPFIAHPVAELTDRTLPLREVFGDAAAGLNAVVDCPDHAVVIDAFETFLRGCHPRADANVEFAACIVEGIARDSSIIKVDQLVKSHRLPIRRLQRLFSEYVGVSPKWVIQRYRIHEAMDRIAAGSTPAWADLAFDLGYADQAHFIRDFKKLIGRSPGEYAKACAA